VKLLKGWRFLEGLRPIIDRMQPYDTAIFHGMLDMKKLNFFEKLAIKNVKSLVGYSHDWYAITPWVKAIADELKKQDQ